MRNHTGTHLLHSALRRVLGDHVRQQGSSVAPDRLRFDFSHQGQVTREELEAVEDLANADVISDDRVAGGRDVHDRSGRTGAIAFFGDKYGDRGAGRAGGRPFDRALRWDARRAPSG